MVVAAQLGTISNGLDIAYLLLIIISSLAGLALVGGGLAAVFRKSLRETRDSEYQQAIDLLRGRVGDLDSAHKEAEEKLSTANTRIDHLEADNERYRDLLTGATAWKRMEAVLEHRERESTKLLEAQHLESMTLMAEVAKQLQIIGDRR